MTDGLDVGRGVSAGLLRAVVAVVCAGIVADLALNRASVVVLGAAVLLSVACVFLPASPAPLLLIALAALLITVSGPDPLRPAVLVLVPLVHLLHINCAIGALLPKGARLDPRALWPAARRVAVVQLVVAALAVLAMVIPAGRTPEPVELIALLSIAGLAAVVIVLDRSR
ncbi:hypothetical protein [Actinokineospora sp. NBRC 105648]|uniref:hypothetical protein n=1 Tax=Actinokineospora sp. NBRC 105648 TaxID=3032206 RepID=UPI0024A507F0|nr:hypothetical protein [Actinokineospora sp. NBRC 105648]GLZ39861.1 hypothetical protein Acsp05_34850 [Actinokineospora sp. NBRC 105648]